MTIITKTGRTLQFKSSYNHCSEYVEHAGRSYYVRFGFHDRCIREELHDEYKRLIGTVKCRYPYSNDFPPQDVVEAVNAHYAVDFVGARYTPDFKNIEYDGSTPPEPVRYGQTTWLSEAYDKACKEVWDNVAN